MKKMGTRMVGLTLQNLFGIIGISACWPLVHQTTLDFFLLWGGERGGGGGSLSLKMMQHSPKKIFLGTRTKLVFKKVNVYNEMFL